MDLSHSKIHLKSENQNFFPAKLKFRVSEFKERKKIKFKSNIFFWVQYKEVK